VNQKNNKKGSEAIKKLGRRRILRKIGIIGNNNNNISIVLHLQFALYRKK
jgi:hypothetical protein